MRVLWLVASKAQEGGSKAESFAVKTSARGSRAH